MPSYLSATDFRTRTGVSTSVTAEALNPMLDAVEFAIRNHIGYDPVSQSYTHYYSGDGTDRLTLWPRPVTAVSSVYENVSGYYQSANFTSAELLTEGTDYAIEVDAGGQPGILRRIGAVWPYMRFRKLDRLAFHRDTAFGSVKVTYTAGLAPSQLSLVKEAGYLTAVVLYRAWSNGMGPIQSESLDGYSYLIAVSQNQNKLNPVVSERSRELLAPLVRIPVG